MPPPPPLKSNSSRVFPSETTFKTNCPFSLFSTVFFPVFVFALCQSERRAKKKERKKETTKNDLYNARGRFFEDTRD
jgi:hypothetical protein